MFKIYYADGTIYDDESHPELAPPVGVQVIVQSNYDKPGYHLQHRSGYYLLQLDWYDEPYWQGADESGKETYMRKPGWKVVLIGETLPNPRYEHILKLADDLMVRLNGRL